VAFVRARLYRNSGMIQPPTGENPPFSGSYRSMKEAQEMGLKLKPALPVPDPARNIPPANVPPPQ
jgi:hypothetical protein